jgi:hypothetical protein
VRQVGTEATVFGLDVRANRPLPFLETARAAPTGRDFEIALSVDGEEPDWPGGELISDERQPDGSIVFQIERGADADYRIWGPGHGSTVISGGGRQLRAAPENGDMDAWQRMLVAQVLPFAAVLRGLEVLHAGAVEMNGGAVALLGPSGAGKTSLALALCHGGATFLADDVLALERRDGELVGHPGAPMAGIDHAEADRLRAEGKAEREELAVNSRERVTRVAVGGEPASLRALFFLDRRSDGPSSPRFEPMGDALPLLGATFNFVLATPERLQSLLEVCALAARLRVERIVVGPDVNATQLALAVDRRMDVSS